jgi:TRAP transporter 4TM/12TM fusion protein
MAAHPSGRETGAGRGGSSTDRSDHSGRGGAAIERFVYWFGATLSLVHVYFNVLSTLPQLWLAAIHFAGFGLICLLVTPPVRGVLGRPVARVAFAFDLLLALALGLAALYVVLAEVPLAARGFDYGALDYIAGIALILLAIELARRTTGPVIPILIIVSVSYVAWWGKYVGGVLHFPGLSLEVVLLRGSYGDEGMFGLVANISSSFVFMFVLFGAFLIRSGAGAFIVDLARAAAGRVTGGPGLAAVIASALTGMVSGSAVANTVSTGVITIPLMKRAGFPPRFAAGVEAAASTGGQLMPPVMGAGAFVMATYTQISYLTIIAVSFLPALLYFIGIAFYVRIQAKKSGLNVDAADAPKFRQVLKGGGLPFLIPIAVLVGLLVWGFTPSYAAGYAILAVIAASWLTPQRMGPRAILDALALGARNMVTTAVLLVAIGLVVNAVSTTGLGNSFALMIAEWSGDSLIIALLLVAVASLVLGMGLPVTASYVVLATLAAPALYDLITRAELIEMLTDGAVPETARAIFALAAPEAVLDAPMSTAAATGLLAQMPPELSGMLREAALSPALLTTALLSAHMIVFWLSQDSNVTPPVCLTAFAAAGIAGTPPMRTGLVSWKIAKSLYAIPVLFAYTPFLSGDIAVALEVFVFACLGIYALTGAIEGYLETALPVPLRPALAGLGVALLWPLAWHWHALVGLAVLAILAWNVRRLATR